MHNPANRQTNKQTNADENINLAEIILLCYAGQVVDVMDLAAVG